MAQKRNQKPVKKAAKKAAKKAVKTAPKKVTKPAKKAATKPAKKQAATPSSAMKNVKTAAKVAGGLALAGVALSAVKIASKAKTDVAKFFSPLDDRIIVEETKKELRTPGGLFIPDTVEHSEGPKEGRVLAVGRGHRTKKGRVRPLDVKLGDTVMFEVFVGDPLKIGDREVTVLRESDLLGVVST